MTNLSKIKNCGQVWDNMPNCKNGKICMKCNETIHDFRGMSDWEIALKHSESMTKVCGIYDANNNTKINDKTESKYSFSALKTIALIGSLASTTVSSGQISDQQLDTILIQNPRNSDKGLLNNQEVVKDSSKTTVNKMIVTGVLQDVNKETIIGANIIIKGTKNGTITDIDGKYILNILDEFSQNDSITLIFQYIGYARKDKIVAKSDFEENDVVEIDIVFDETVYLEAFGVIRFPWYKRIWNKLF